MSVPRLVRPMRRIGIVCAVLLLPVSAQAAVTFSEVAWMGDAASANHEWIELQNTGDAVVVDGWKIVDGMNLLIELAGTVPANSYVVLERTADTSAASAAFLIYTGALVNTGATLQLLRSDDTIVDQVSGGENWVAIGGDNETKETAQYTSAGWVTAAATPGKGITAAEVAGAAKVAEREPARSAGSGRVQKSDQPEALILTLPGVTLALQPVGPTVGYVNQSLAFSVVASGIGDTLIDSLRYEWNFGDGTTAATQAVSHTYAYPGNYVITVFGGYKRQEQVARHEVTILPVTASLTMNAAGDVQVNNDSPYEIDVSGYRVKGETTFTFPPRSIMLPHQTITIPKAQVTKASDVLVALYDAESALVASLLPAALRSPTAAVAAAAKPPVPQISALATSRQVPAAAGSFAPAATEVAAASVPAATVSEPVLGPPQLAAAAGSGSKVDWTYLMLIITLLVAVVGVYARPVRDENG